MSDIELKPLEYMRAYADLLNERNAAVAQATELRARWESVPHDDIATLLRAMEPARLPAERPGDSDVAAAWQRVATWNGAMRPKEASRE